MPPAKKKAKAPPTKRRVDLLLVGKKKTLAGRGKALPAKGIKA